ncbi:hypothetical protein OG203_27505 [Nocardia sp. NBC_01499]|uniref:Rv0361 family membrane protein n=1 Tax=Nocardia sp. NBC_01499 TaxID=2903597 RepID=UPI003864C78B
MNPPGQSKADAAKTGSASSTPPDSKTAAPKQGKPVSGNVLSDIAKGGAVGQTAENAAIKRDDQPAPGSSSAATNQPRVPGTPTPTGQPSSKTAAAQQKTPTAAPETAAGKTGDTPDTGETPSGPTASEAKTEVIKRGAQDQPGAAASGKVAPGQSTKADAPATPQDSPAAGAPGKGAAATTPGSPAPTKSSPVLGGAKTGAAQASTPDKPVAPEQTAPKDDVADGDAPTTVMRVQRPAPPVADAGAEADTVKMQTTAKDAGQQAPPGSEDVTMAMPVIKPDDAQTVALPIQRPADAPKPAGTDRVTPPAGRVPITKPPATPRSAPGPKQPGPQGPSGPPQSGPGPVDDTRSAPPHPGVQRQHGSAPSPADVQPTMPAQQLGGPRPPQPRPIAQPQRITPAAQAPPVDAGAPAAAPGRSKRWLLAVAGAAALVVVLVGVIVAVFVNSTDNSPEKQVRAAITDYTQALKTGDLTTLRGATCGPLHDFYQGIPADQFASVHQLSMDRRTIPVVDGVDAVKITDKTAVAQASVYTEADPDKRSARTFDLQQTDNGWKVCDPPTSTP